MNDNSWFAPINGDARLPSQKLNRLVESRIRFYSEETNCGEQEQEPFVRLLNSQIATD
jgi:hypothetical protein